MNILIGLLGTIVNTIAVIIGGLIGLLIKKGIPEKLNDNLFKALGLVVVFIGINGCVGDADLLIVTISMILGTIIGVILKLHSRIDNLGNFLSKKLDKHNPNSTIAQGFVSASMLFCVGSMAIIGCLQAGINGDNSILFTKSTIDLCCAIIFASTMGLGVLFSAIMVLLYQGTLTILAIWISPYLNEIVIMNMSCVGYIIIIGLGLTMIKSLKAEITNFVPAIFLPILICPISDWLSTFIKF